MSRHIEKYTTPSDKGGSTIHETTFLDIRLTSADTAQLTTALNEACRPPQLMKTSLGSITTTNRPGNSLVSVPEPNLLRIAWRGGPGYLAIPGLKRVFAELKPWVKVGQPTRHDETQWRKLKGAELDDRILRLVEIGDRITAINLLPAQRNDHYTGSRVRRIAPKPLRRKAQKRARPLRLSTLDGVVLAGAALHSAVGLKAGVVGCLACVPSWRRLGSTGLSPVALT